jgi:hypothetical protein
MKYYGLYGFLEYISYRYQASNYIKYLNNFIGYTIKICPSRSYSVKIYLPINYWTIDILYHLNNLELNNNFCDNIYAINNPLMSDFKIVGLKLNENLLVNVEQWLYKSINRI